VTTVKNCREFEDNLSRYFADVEADLCRGVVAHEEWHKIPCRDDFHRALIAHASKCSDCTQSLLQYLDLRGQVDYRAFPCFHLAYYSTAVDEHCIENDHGFFSIRLDGVSGIGIGYCPWCGTKLVISHAKAIGERKNQKNA
jgi:hypothetical protein